MNTPEYLKSIGACQAAIDQVGARPLKRAVSESVRPDWLFWLVATNANKSGWPDRKSITQLLAEAYQLCGSLGAPEVEAIANAHRVGFRPDFVKLVVRLAEGIPMPGEALCNLLRNRLEMPFLDTLDKA